MTMVLIFFAIKYLNDFDHLSANVYLNGKLIYKKWLNTGESKVFDVMAYDKYTLKSITKAE